MFIYHTSSDKNMWRVYISICCCIPLLNAGSLKIDGLSDLGVKWSYDYKIVKQPDNKRSEQHQPAQLETATSSGYSSREEQIRRNNGKYEHHMKHKIKDSYKKRLKTRRNPRYLDPIIHKEGTEQKPVKISNKEKLSSSEDSSYQNITVYGIKWIDMDNFTTTKNYANIEATTKSTGEIRKRSEDEDLDLKPEISFVKDSTMFVCRCRPSTQQPPKAIARHDVRSCENGVPSTHDRSFVYKADTPTNKDNRYIESGRYSNVEPDHPVDENPQSNILNGDHQLEIDQTSSTANTSATTISSTTVKVTTVRTDNIYNDPHKIIDDVNVRDFINHTYRRTLKVFDAIKSRTNNYHFRREVNLLRQSYEEKFNDFIKETVRQTIKTRLGIQKVILNSIDLSNHILKRLSTYMMVQMDRRGVLRNNVNTANIFQKEIENVENMELQHVCRKFGICRTQYDCSKFFIDLIDIQLKMDPDRFTKSFNAFTEVLKNTYFECVSKETNDLFHKHILRLELLEDRNIRPMLMIGKNTIANKNKPLKNKNKSEETINATLVFLEVVDIFDQNIPGIEKNLVEWDAIKSNLKDYADEKSLEVLSVWQHLIYHLGSALQTLNEETIMTLNKHINFLLSRVPT